MANPQVVQVYITPEKEYYVDERETPLSLDELKNKLGSVLKGHKDASVVVRSDKTVGVQYVVNVIDLVNNINDERGTTHKVVLATQPK